MGTRFDRSTNWGTFGPLSASLDQFSLGTAGRLNTLLANMNTAVETINTNVGNRVTKVATAATRTVVIQNGTTGTSLIGAPGFSVATTGVATIKGGFTCGTSSGVVNIGRADGSLGFYGIATPRVKTSVTGAKASTQALVNLLSYLSLRGLLINATT